MIEKDLAAAKVAFANLIDKDVPAFNRAMTGQGLPALGAPVTP